MPNLALNTTNDFESFFSAPPSGTVLRKLEQEPSSQWQPQKAQIWYDSIIDWMFANPGGSIVDCAGALGRSPATIGLIARSDLFKARYVQRRESYNLELDRRLVGRLTKITEKGLDAIITVLETKQDKIPLPLLNELTKTAMDRLGYGTSRGESPAVHVSINNSQSNLPESVSASSLEKARENMKLLQGMKLVGSSGSAQKSDDLLRRSEEGEE